MTKLHDYYKDGVIKKLMTEFSYNLVMQAPRAGKIALNMGVDETVVGRKLPGDTATDLTAISGQKPLIIKARKSVAGFRIRQGYPVGCKVTLRGEHMWGFFEHLITIAVPRIRDLRGLSAKSFDGYGNYSTGAREQITFPEIDYDKIDHVHGLDITITTAAKSDERGRALLAAFDSPLRK